MDRREREDGERQNGETWVAQQKLRRGEKTEGRHWKQKFEHSQSTNREKKWDHLHVSTLSHSLTLTHTQPHTHTVLLLGLQSGENGQIWAQPMAQSIHWHVGHNSAGQGFLCVYECMVWVCVFMSLVCVCVTESVSVCCCNSRKRSSCWIY